MKLRRLTLALVAVAALFSPSIGQAAAPEEENPFFKEFGGPHKEGVDAEFRRDAVEVSMSWKGAFASLGVGGLEDPGIHDFIKQDIDPMIAKLKPDTPAETKMKEAARFVRRLMVFAGHPDKIPEEERKSLQAFLDSCKLPMPGTAKTEKLGNALILYSCFNLGMTLAEMEAVKKAMPKEEK